MAIQLSPGVSVAEYDLTTVVPAVSSSTGAFAGNFSWGPALQAIPVSDENQLSVMFGTPNNNTAISFMTAASFLAYGNDLRVVRALNANSFNADANTTATNLQIANKSIYDYQYFNGDSNAIGAFAARYAGALGNSISIDVWDSTNTTEFKAWKFAGNFSGPTTTSSYVSNAGGSNDELHIIVSDTLGTITGAKGAILEAYPYLSKAADAVDGNGVSTYYKNVLESSSQFIYAIDPVDYANTTVFGTAWGSIAAGTNFARSYTTEIQSASKCIVGATYTIISTGTTSFTAIGALANTVGTTFVATAAGTGTGTAVLVHFALYGATNALVSGFTYTIQNLGTTTNTVWNTIAGTSGITYGVGSVFTAGTIANIATGTGTGTALLNPGNITVQLSGGTDAPVTDGDLIIAYNLFENRDLIDISLVITGNAGVTVQQYIADNIVTPVGSVAGRSGDAIAFFSPPISAVVNQHNFEAANILTWLTDPTVGLQRSSSYIVMDSGWKYMYDKYNNVYRWIPLNGDIAGLCAFTDAIRDPWWSPAGYNRGNIKNAVKLAWNPNQTSRDILYPQGVNPVVSFPGNGIILYGDKTLQAKPSAFDRINVRRLFIVLEKAIALAAKYSLFEFNDDFTRAQFISLVAPFLRDVQGRRGITDFKVVCDTTNNTGYVIDNNQFVGDIYIKPARSINFIKLNFIAVGTAVNFSEVVGSV